MGKFRLTIIFGAYFVLSGIVADLGQSSTSNNNAKTSEPTKSLSMVSSKRLQSTHLPSNQLEFDFTHYLGFGESKKSCKMLLKDFERENTRLWEALVNLLL